MGRDKSDRVDERWVVTNYETQSVERAQAEIKVKRRIVLLLESVGGRAGGSGSLHRTGGKAGWGMEEDAWETGFGERRERWDVFVESRSLSRVKVTWEKDSTINANGKINTVKEFEEDPDTGSPKIGRVSF